MTEADELLAKAERYLASARLLLGAGDFDSSVSRAYYAMFFAAEAILLKMGLVFSSHKGVIMAFGEKLVKTGRVDNRFGRSLARAFEKRQAADYSYGSKIRADEADALLTEAAEFIAVMREIDEGQEPGAER